MQGWDPEGRTGKPFPLPDAVTILEPKEEQPIAQPMSESRMPVAAPPAAEVAPQEGDAVAEAPATAGAY
jgi:small subunit ribosomal protein S3e